MPLCPACASAIGQRTKHELRTRFSATAAVGLSLRFTLACGSRITSHSFVPRSPKFQGVVTPAAPDGLLVDLWGPVVGIYYELLTCEVWAVAEFVDAEHS